MERRLPYILDISLCSYRLDLGCRIILEPTFIIDVSFISLSHVSSVEYHSDIGNDMLTFNSGCYEDKGFVGTTSVYKRGVDSRELGAHLRWPGCARIHTLGRQ